MSSHHPMHAKKHKWFTGRVLCRNVCLSFPWERARKSTVAEFAILGFDFLIDGEGRAWNIEVCSAVVTWCSFT